MRPDDVEARMRRLECFHALRVPDGAWVVLRLDGRGFTRLTETRCEKPFDERFHGWLVAAARAVLEDFGGLYAYTQSDEVSVLLPRGWAHFDREVEKAVPASAGGAALVVRVGLGVSPDAAVGGVLARHAGAARLVATNTARQCAALEFTHAVALRPGSAALDLIGDRNRVEGVQGVEWKESTPPA